MKTQVATATSNHKVYSLEGLTAKYLTYKMVVQQPCTLTQTLTLQLIRTRAWDRQTNNMLRRPTTVAEDEQALISQGHL